MIRLTEARRGALRGHIAAFVVGLVTSPDYAETVDVDLSRTRVHDHSAIQALESLVGRYARAGKRIDFTGLSENCERIVRKAYAAVPVR